jgi:hypothetical protein
MKSINEIVREQILEEAAQMPDPTARLVYVEEVINRMPQVELLERISDALASYAGARS